MSTRIQECYIEGQRCLLARFFLPVGETYSSHYLAYERRQPAAADMLYLDALVVEDSRRSGHSGLRKNHQFACSELGVPAVVGIGCSKEHWPSGVSVQCRANAALPRASSLQDLTFVSTPRAASRLSGVRGL